MDIVNSSMSDMDYEPQLLSLKFNNAVHNVCLIAGEIDAIVMHY